VIGQQQPRLGERSLDPGRRRGAGQEVEDGGEIS
jgi:hypothetical protein